jgi:hypothetical protein
MWTRAVAKGQLVAWGAAGAVGIGGAAVPPVVTLAKRSHGDGGGAVLPPQPALEAGVFAVVGTANANGVYYPLPPDAPIDPVPRRPPFDFRR